MDHIIVLFSGILLCTIGIININGNINSIHWYNRRKVKKEDIPKYGKVVGTGTLIIGLSSIIYYLLLVLENNIPAEYIVVPPIIIGIIVIVYGQFKYNKGII